MIRTRARLVGLSFFALLSILTVGACDDDPAGPDPLSGTWVATTLEVTPEGENAIDVLAEGGELSITFGSGFSMTGSLSVPASVAGEEIDASMAGTYTRRGSTIEFTQSADTFVRDLDWVIVGNTLEGSGAFEAAGFEVVLTRQ